MKVYFINIGLANIVASNRVSSGISLNSDLIKRHSDQVILSSLQYESITLRLHIKEEMHE